MKVYVLSLEGAKERQDRICAQLTEAGVDFELFLGVDGRKGFHPLFNKYNEGKRLEIKGEPLLPGQLGCFASHYLLWQRCSEKGEPCIILEDDAKLDLVRFKEFVALSGDLPGHYECVRLFRNKSRIRRSILVDIVDNFEFRKYLKGHMSTTGYYITPEGASKYLDSAEQWVLPVDIYMDQFWNNKVECYGVEPPCLTNDEGFESLIGYIPKGKKDRRSVLVRLRRERYLLRNNVRRFFWNARFILGNF